MTTARTALLLGAGFSAEMGMPLVWELTNDELRAWLTPDKFKSLNQAWLEQGGGYPAEVVDEFLPVLTDPNQHYEQIIGWLQTKYLEPGGRYHQEYYGLHHWLLDLVGFLLLERHRKNEHYIRASAPFYKGLLTFVNEDAPLWVFSLNHDLCLEMVAGELGIPLTLGFPDDRVSQPIRDDEGNPAGRVEFQRITRDRMKHRDFDYLAKGSRGINLVKIHGSLEVFAFDDEKEFWRGIPSDFSIGGWNELLTNVNDRMYWEHQGRKAKGANHVFFADDDGEIQVMSRTLLSGAYKFEERISQVAPPELLALFENQLQEIDRLVVIGYSLGDKLGLPRFSGHPRPLTMG
jgi:hypothetical protein